MWPHSVGKGEVTQATFDGWHSEYFDILRSARSKVSSDNDTCPRSHQLQGMASRGKFPLRGTTYTTDCAYEKQRLILRVAVEGIATKGLLTTC